MSQSKRPKDMTPEELKAYKSAQFKQWRLENPEKMKAAKDRWNAANKERVKEVTRAYWKANPQKKKECRERAKEKHPERIKAQKDAGHARNRAREKEQNRAWRLANPEKIKANKRRSMDRCRESTNSRKRKQYQADPSQNIRYELKRHNGLTDPPPELVAAIVSLRKIKRAIKERC